MRHAPKDGAWALSWRIAIIVIATLPVVHAHSQAGVESRSGTMRFDLDAQPLDAALAAYGRLTGHSVLVTSELTAHRQAAAVHDDLPPREALRQLLAGTDLEARYTTATAFTLVPSGAGPGAGPTTASAPTQTGNRMGGSNYAAVMQTAITRVLCDSQPETFGRFRIALQLWIDQSGRITDARVLEPSGLSQRDAAVLEQMRNMVLDAQPPPALAQPVTILLAPRPDPTRDCERVRSLSLASDDETEPAERD